MVEILIGEVSKGYKNKNSETKLLKKKDKYALMKRFQSDRQLQIYMYAFVYIDPETISETEYFPDTKTLVQKYHRSSTPGLFLNYGLGFSYVFRRL